MVKSWTIGSSLVTVVEGEVSLLYKSYPLTTTGVPDKAHWLLVRKPALTLIGSGQVWVRFKNDVRNASCVLKFQVSSNLKELDFIGGKYYSHYDTNQVMVRDSLDF